MTNSLTTHCILTEPVCKTMSGKGREGNKEGKGREVREDFHHIVTLGNARIGQPRAAHHRDVMVSATRIDTDLTTIEHLDFDPVIPCEAGSKKSGKHGAPADVLIVGQCAGCRSGSQRRYGSCWRHWRQAERTSLTCESCGHVDLMGGGFFRIVEVLR